MSYVDVETSAEALQEAEELIEAVNEIVEAAATAVYTDIKNDVSGALAKTRYVLETAFPFLIDWKEDPAAFPNAMKSLGLSFLLYLIAFFILSPSNVWRADHHRQRKRFQTLLLTTDKRTSSLKLLRRKLATTFNKKPKKTKKRMTKQQQQQQQQQQRRRPFERSHSASSITLLRWRSQLYPFRKTIDPDEDDDDCDDDEEEEEEETEEQKFAQRWLTILETKYGCLVLPPECKRVEKPKNRRETDLKRTSSIGPAAPAPAVPTTAPEPDRPESDDENPYKRLVNYWRHFLHLMMSLLKYDYVGAGYSLFHWLDWWLQNRQRLNDDVVDDEVSDNGTLGVVRKLSFGSDGSNTTRIENPIPAPVPSPKGKSRSKRDTIVKSSRSDSEGSSNTGETTDTVDRLPKLSLLEMSKLNEEKSDGGGSVFEDIATSWSGTLESPPSTPKAGRRSSTPGSVYSTPGLDSRDRNTETVVDAMLPTLSISVRSNQLNGIHKPKDALEIYRKPVVLSKSVHPSSLLDSLSVLQASSRVESTGENSTMNSTWDVSSAAGSSNNTHNMNQEADRDHRGKSFYFETASTQAEVKRMSVEVPVPDRNGYIVGDEFLPDEQEWKPLLVFVNSRSGPQQGQFLIAQLRGLLNPIQVWDLATGGPEEILESFINGFSRLRILVCGGDGTVSWIVSTIDSMNLQRKPPIAILPLGTGNDLARIHGWGGGYNNEPLTAILEQVADSYISWLDRWEMTIEDKRGKVKEVKSFFNYLGVGADAQAALQVHLVRTINVEFL